MNIISEDWEETIEIATEHLLNYGKSINRGSWQGYRTEGKPDLETLEVLNLTIEGKVHKDLQRLQDEIKPNLPWADDHFAERVSRAPSNPGEAYLDWPWWRGQHAVTQEGGVFTHTYQERFWPKTAGSAETHGWKEMHGIRYRYGDLDDVVNLLFKSPYTRQATFPIFFPEDTGAVHGGRTPCTLHYHFLLSNGQLNMWYPIRSCDLIRHFRDDLYMACRLLLWVLDELSASSGPPCLDPRDNLNPIDWTAVEPGNLFFTAYSFHVHKGDLHHVWKKREEGRNLSEHSL